MSNTNEQYHAIKSGAAICRREDRAVIQVAGSDRAGWLHNLVTNAVKTLQPGEGNYAFALSAKGRILFDLNVLVFREVIWVDIDRGLVDKALAHFERHHITEDVQLAAVSEQYGRLDLYGPETVRMAAALGAAHAAAMADLGSTGIEVDGKHAVLFRQDEFGVLGLGVIVPRPDVETWWTRLLQVGRPAPVDRAVLDIVRIEAGIPAYGWDMDEETLPAETGQLSRAVSFTKGCYLGQEIVERMRSRGGLAHKLVRLRLSDPGVDAGVTLALGDTIVGKLTSVCTSPTMGVIGLGRVKASHAEPGTKLRCLAAAPVDAEIVGSSPATIQP